MDKSDVALNKYLRELGQTSLLTPEEEIELGHKIQKGDAAAREKMIQANLRLVVTIARDYVDLGVPLIDLIAEGNIGLMNAVDRFDPDKGAKLSTYAVWWIKQTIKRALANQSKTIRVPSQMLNKITRMRRVSAQLSYDLGREATEQELSEELGIASEKIERLKAVGLRPTSLDAPVGYEDEECRALSETIADEQAPTPFETLRGQDFSDQLDSVLNTLNKREATIIAHRFGLNGIPAKPLQQVAELVGVTRERVRQLEIAALAKLRRAFNKALGSLESELLAA
jgi:RNA polymerase primary sigma factor